MHDHLKRTMAHLTYGIYVLTTRVGDTINGMIASWVAQVSFDPPLVMVAVHPNRYSHTLLEQSGCFALHVLDRDQAPLLSRFKGPDPTAKFTALDWHAGSLGCPILSDCIGVVECRVIATLAPGNHTLFIGEVVSATFQRSGRPLCTLDYEGCYTGRN